MENYLINLMTGNPLIKWLPLFILFHVIIGTGISIYRKEFKFDKLINFMKNGTLIFSFLMILEFLYQGANDSNLGYIFITGIEGIRAVSWLSACVYYIANIYNSFKKIGMVRFKKLEQELKNQLEGEEY